MTRVRSKSAYFVFLDNLRIVYREIRLAQIELTDIWTNCNSPQGSSQCPIQWTICEIDQTHRKLNTYWNQLQSRRFSVFIYYTLKNRCSFCIFFNIFNQNIFNYHSKIYLLYSWKTGVLQNQNPNRIFYFWNEERMTKVWIGNSAVSPSSARRHIRELSVSPGTGADNSFWLGQLPAHRLRAVSALPRASFSLSIEHIPILLLWLINYPTARNEGKNKKRAEK